MKFQTINLWKKILNHGNITCLFDDNKLIELILFPFDVSFRYLQIAIKKIYYRCP